MAMESVLTLLADQLPPPRPFHRSCTTRWPRGLEQYRSATLALNFAGLGAVSLVPFSADLVRTERTAENWSMVVFAVNVGLLSLTVGLLARHVLREPHLVHSDRSMTVLSRYQLHHLYGLLTVAMISAPLAFVEPYRATGTLLAYSWSSSGAVGTSSRLHTPTAPGPAPLKGQS